MLWKGPNGPETCPKKCVFTPLYWPYPFWPIWHCRFSLSLSKWSWKKAEWKSMNVKLEHNLHLNPYRKISKVSLSQSLRGRFYCNPRNIKIVEKFGLILCEGLNKSVPPPHHRPHNLGTKSRHCRKINSLASRGYKLDSVTVSLFEN